MYYVAETILVEWDGAVAAEERLSFLSSYANTVNGKQRKTFLYLSGKRTMTRKYNKNGRYGNGDDSNRKGRYGDFEHEGKNWTPEQDDALLEGVLVQNLAPVSFAGNPSYQTELGRTWKACWTRVWKLAVKRFAGGHTDYCPGKRTDRTGQSFRWWDLEVLLHVTGEAGQKGGGCDADHVGRLLQRSPGDVADYLQAAVINQGRGKGFGVREQLAPGQETTEARLQRLLQSLPGNTLRQRLKKVQERMQ